MYTSYIIFKCLFAQVLVFSNSTTCELQGQKKKILRPCIFTGNTWIYHQMVMFLLKAPSLKKLYFTLSGSGRAKHVRVGGQEKGCDPLFSGEDRAIATKNACTHGNCDYLQKTGLSALHHREGPHEASWILEGLGAIEAIHGL